MLSLLSVRIFCISYDDDHESYYIVSEYMVNGSLKKYLKSTPFLAPSAHFEFCAMVCPRASWFLLSDAFACR